MPDFHVPFLTKVYRDLREAAARSSRLATDLARQAIEQWLHHRHSVARYEAIAAFAAEPRQRRAARRGNRELVKLAKDALPNSPTSPI